MEDNNVIEIPRQSCCRLCLAPASECVTIFGATAADKQPISLKIQACVNIQVNPSDRLSGQICHVCISFLNAWASFKNRCLTAQRQQKGWLAVQLKRQLGLHAATDEQPVKDDDDTDPVNVAMELDPAAFLAGDDDGNEDDDDDGLEEGEFIDTSFSAAGSAKRINSNEPQILNALGLRNVNMNPMSVLSTDLLSDDLEDGGAAGDESSLPAARCRVCHMQFSNRANARRHEKNIHGIRSSMMTPGTVGAGSGPVQTPSSSLNGTPIIPTKSISIMQRSEGGGVAGSIMQRPGGSGASGSIMKRPGGSSASASRRKKPVDEVFDPSKPEKYRHLLTEARISFIRRNARFLHQYQDMTCRCCDRQYATYKAFMSHMRKKYTSLPRNVCFTCLRKFETKGMFIAHLKKRNCVNLFTVFMGDPSIPKDAKLVMALKGTLGGTGAAGTNEQRIGLKELLSNKIYGCQECKEQFRLKSEFRIHVGSAHPELCRDPQTGNCRHCHATFVDKAERKRHFSVMDCLVVIICSTCDTQFAAHAEFLDHVYGTHLKELNEADQRAAAAISERLAEAGGLVLKDEESRTSAGGGNSSQLLLPKKNSGCVCPICEKQYNNYYNVLWHFESKHPEYVPKTYKCEVCPKMFTKQALLKSHVQTEHGDLLLLTEGGTGVGSFQCRHCEIVLRRAQEYIAHQVDEHPDEELLACHECEFVTEERVKLEEHLRGQHLNVGRLLSAFACAACKLTFVAEDALKCHQIVQHAETESSEQIFRRMSKAGKFPAKAKPVVDEGTTRIKQETDYLDDEEMKSEGEDMEEDDEGEESSSFMNVTSQSATHTVTEEQRVRECPICIEKFPSLGDFARHMRRHVETDNVTNLDIELGKSKSGGYHSRMRCRMCKRRISSKVGYKRHLMEEHGIDDCAFVRCDLCPGEFSNEKGLKVHLYRTHNICVKEDGEVVTMGPVQLPMTGDSTAAAQKEYECQICHTVYRSLGQLKSHVQAVHQQNDFEAYIQQYGSGEVTMSSSSGVAGRGGGGGRNDEQQHQLDAMSLMMMSGALMDQVEPDVDGRRGQEGGALDYTPIEVWFQCRYCDDNFSSRQKLTAHMNTHEEHDPTDYTCRECGNVYQSRKSLWVHRNKKHAGSQVPSPCEICKKVFFDKTELFFHLKTHVAQKMELMHEFMTAAAAVNGRGSLMGAEDHDHDDEDGEEGLSGEDDGQSNGADGTANGVRKYDCHVCNRKFRDPEKLSQHLRLHEMQNNMFVLGAFAEAGMEEDGGGGGAGASYLNGEDSGGDPFEPQFNADGVEEYVCDMCPKRFPQLMALRVHRGWHYRSPDGRQITEPGQTWQPGSLRSQRGSKGGSGGGGAAAVARSSSTVDGVKSERDMALNNNNNNLLNNNKDNSNSSSATNSTSTQNPRLPKCQFCNSTFASANNLRRHIVEVHKRHDWRAQQQQPRTGAGGSAAGFIERDRECTACRMSFETRAEWVEHKIGHARVMRPSKTFEWNCEMCGKVFTRKERLLQHMATHATEEGTAGQVSNRQGGMKGTTAEGSDNSQGMMTEGEEEDGDYGEEEEEEEGEAMVVNPEVEMLGDDDYDEQEEEEEKKAVKGEAEKKAASSSLCCDLCQVEFTDANELRKHVMSHFFNGGGGVVGEEKKKPEEMKQERERDEDSDGGEAPQAKKAKLNIPEMKIEGDAADGGAGESAERQERRLERDEDDMEEEEEGEVTVAGEKHAELSLNSDVVGEEEDGDEEDDVDEGEYVEEYFDEDSLVAVSPKKTAATTTVAVRPQQTVPQQQQCRLCSTGYENSFKALKCMESHRQRSKYQCNDCELYFATPRQLSGHQQLIHGGA